MRVYSLYVLNRAGGLIYQNDVHPGLSKLTANDYLVLAGTLHSVHAIASKITPTFNSPQSQEVDTQGNASLLYSGKFQNSNANKTGLQTIETDEFNLYIFQSLTGVKFIIITTPNPVVSTTTLTEKPRIGELTLQYDQVSLIFRKLYIIYSDYVMKDPFYSTDMPIKSNLFESKVKELLA